jgi:hypothetical protein
MFSLDKCLYGYRVESKTMESNTTQIRRVPWKWIAVVACVIIVIMASFQLYVSASNILVSKHMVQVRYGNVSGGWRPYNILVVFTQNNQAKAYCIVRISSSAWQNITLFEGFYIVKLYNADSGIYLRQFELCIFKDVQFTMADI